MLDIFIIDRIRREKERQKRDNRIPLHIDDRRPNLEDQSERTRPEPRRDERGSTIIDFKL